MASVDPEKLLAELQDKEHKLVKAAGYGKDLLEENEKLRNDLKGLQLDCARLEEGLESKQLEFAKTLGEATTVAEELEVELENCRSDLELERGLASAAREEFQRSRKRQDEENAELEQQLTQEKEKHATEICQLNKRLQESERLREIMSSDYNQARQYLQQLENENQEKEKSLSFVYRSNEKLSTELEGTKDAAGFWEEKYHSQEEILQFQSKELDTSKHLQKQLQLELHLKYLPGTMVSRESPSSSVSLYDELSQGSAEDMEQRHGDPSGMECRPENPMGGDIECTHENPADSHVEWRQGNPSDTFSLSDIDPYPYMSDDEKVLTLRPKRTVCEATSSNCCQMEEEETSQRAASTCQRPRCQELERHHMELEVEVNSLNELVLMAAQQKFKLQQQIELWECDMAQVLGSQMKHKLINLGIIKIKNS